MHASAKVRYIAAFVAARQLIRKTKTSRELKTFKFKELFATPVRKLFVDRSLLSFAKKIAETQNLRIRGSQITDVAATALQNLL